MPIHRFSDGRLLMFDDTRSQEVSANATDAERAAAIAAFFPYTPQEPAVLQVTPREIVTAMLRGLRQAGVITLAQADAARDAAVDFLKR